MLRATFISIRTSTWEVTKSAGFFTFPELFQFTPLHERQHRFQYTPSLQKVFQFTPIHERRRFGCRSSRDLQNFNSRLCMRGNTMDDSAQLQGIWFQFTPLHNRQPQNSGSSPGTFPFQFTPIHERRRANGFHHAILHSISIHASTWEAAGSHTLWHFHHNYFNSRLYMRGSTVLGADQDWALAFQFTPLHERQLVLKITMENSTLFQFTPLHERQQAKAFRWTIRKYFNSRLYMRGNRCVRFQCISGFYFNSRLYMRGSDGKMHFSLDVAISIHASTWEAANPTMISCSGHKISIHASTWEAAWNLHFQYR